MDNSELLIIKAELTNDPLELGLTTAPEDDEANANILNEVRDSIQLYKASVSANDFAIPVAEWNALTTGQQSWLTAERNDGSINPAVFGPEFYEMFSESTEARANFDAVATESASRARQLLERYVTLTPSDIADARNAT